MQFDNIIQQLLCENNGFNVDRRGNYTFNFEQLLQSSNDYAVWIFELSFSERNSGGPMLLEEPGIWDYYTTHFIRSARYQGNDFAEMYRCCYAISEDSKYMPFVQTFLKTLLKLRNLPLTFAVYYTDSTEYEVLQVLAKVDRATLRKLDIENNAKELTMNDEDLL